jgi:predicted hydrocarbon binding protein
MNTEEKAKILMEKPGRTKGESIMFIANYIKDKEGEGEFSRLEKKLEELGYPFDFNKVKPFDWIKEGYVALTLNLAKDLFEWTDEDIFNAGKEEPKKSFITKILMKYLVSLEKTLQEASTYWEKFYDFGFIEMVKYNKEEKFFVLRVHKYDIDEVMCKYHAGFFFTMAELNIRSKDISIEETMCTHRGDDCHEYTVKWDEK